jgi:hypothetical protein
LNSQVVSSTARQELASAGFSFCSASCASSASKMWARSALLGVRLWKCGSIEVGSADRPTLSSCASAGAAPNTAATPATASPFHRCLIPFSWSFARRRCRTAPLIVALSPEF